MSGNLELVERAIASLNARDIESYLAVCSDDIELETPTSVIGGSYRGRDGIRRFFNDIEDAAPDFRLEVRRFEEFGPQSVLATIHVDSTGRASGIDLGAETTNLYECLEGKIRRVRVFSDRAAALRAAGAEG